MHMGLEPASIYRYESLAPTIVPYICFPKKLYLCALYIQARRGEGII